MLCPKDPDFALQGLFPIFSSLLFSFVFGSDEQKIGNRKKVWPTLRDLLGLLSQHHLKDTKDDDVGEEDHLQGR